MRSWLTKIMQIYGKIISIFLFFWSSNRFRTCLKMADSGDANIVGKLFFNFMQIKCFVLVSCRTSGFFFLSLVSYHLSHFLILTRIHQKPEKTCILHSYWWVHILCGNCVWFCLFSLNLQRLLIFSGENVWSLRPRRRPIWEIIQSTEGIRYSKLWIRYQILTHVMIGSVSRVVRG